MCVCVCGDKHGLCHFQNLDSISLVQGHNYEASNENLTYCSQVIVYKVRLLTISSKFVLTHLPACNQV